MHRVILLVVVASLLAGCTVIPTSLFHKGTKQQYTQTVPDPAKDFEKAIADGRVTEGMTTDMVEKSWGEPQSKIPLSDVLTLWKYSSTELYFVNDVLLTRKEASEVNAVTSTDVLEK